MSRNIWSIVSLITFLLVAATPSVQADGPIVGIIVDDDRPRIEMKMAEYVNDFLVYEVEVITKSQYKTGLYSYAATVEVDQYGSGDVVSLGLLVRNGGNVSSYGGGIRYDNTLPSFVTHNYQALNAALFVLKNLSTDSWKNLVEEFQDHVEDLEDMD